MWQKIDSGCYRTVVGRTETNAGRELELIRVPKMGWKIKLEGNQVGFENRLETAMDTALLSL